MRGALLAGDLEVALLESLEITHAVIGQEVQAELDTLYLFDDEFDYLERVSLLVYLLDNIGLLHEDRVNELHQFVLKSESFLPQLTVEHARVVNVELLAGLKVLCFFLHCHIRAALSAIGSSLDCTAFKGGS